MSNQFGDGAREAPLALAFAPIHKLALGIASGSVFGVLLAALTLIAMLIDAGGGHQATYLGLLNSYFYGYSVSSAGALVGLFWGFVVGFVSGFFAAFVRNLAITVTIFALRTKAELAQTNDFLDHI